MINIPIKYNTITGIVGTYAKIHKMDKIENEIEIYTLEDKKLIIKKKPLITSFKNLTMKLRSIKITQPMMIF